MEERKITPVIIVIVLVAAAVGGYIVFLKGGGEGTSTPEGTGENPPLTTGGSSTVTSVDLTLNGYEKLGAEKFSWNSVLIQARNFDNSLDWRVEVKAGGPGGDIFIYSHSKDLLYAYDNSEDTWYGGDASGEIESNIKDNYDGLVTTAQDWASKHGGTGEYTETYDGDWVKININAKNTELSDKLFSPPEDASVESFDLYVNLF